MDGQSAVAQTAAAGDDRGMMRTLPREIAPDVFCVGPNGRSQTDVYLVRSESSFVLVDAGWANDGPAIKAAAEGLFGVGVPAAAILLTHCHPDHSGSARELAQRWDCPVFVHDDELPIARGDVAAISAGGGPLDSWIILPLLRLMGPGRLEAVLAGSSLGELVRALDPDGGVPGLPGWRWIHTPGHTPGHVSFFRPADRVLITGDAILTLKVNSPIGALLGKRGLSGPPWYTSWSWPLARSSITALAGLEPSVLAVGHGTPMNGPGTARVVRAFADQFSGLPAGRRTQRPRSR